MSDYKGGGRGSGDRGFNPNGSGGVVRVYDNNIDRAISQLKKKSSDKLRELRSRECFVPNTLKRRMKMAEAKMRQRRVDRSQEF